MSLSMLLSLSVLKTLPSPQAHPKKGLSANMGV